MSQCNLQRIPCYMSDMYRNCEKKCTLNFDINTYSSLENNIQKMAKSQKTTTLTYAKAAMLNCNKTLHVCVVTDICRNMYIKCITKEDYDFHKFCCITILTTCIQILYMKNNIYVHPCDKRLKETSDENPVVHIMLSIQMESQFLKALNQRPEYVCTCYHCMLFHKTVQQLSHGRLWYK